MKLAFITPLNWIEQFGNQGDFHLVLSHLLNRDIENEYEKKMKESGKNLVLDNGTFENGKPEGIDSLLNKALRIKAKVFFAPDYLYNAKLTREAFENTKYIMKKQKALDKIKIGVVIQASTQEEWLEEYKYFCDQPEVGLIGLSILAIPRCFGSWNTKKHAKNEEYSLKIEEITPSRLKCLESLKNMQIKHKFCHLLGQGSNQSDLIYAKENCPWIISNDSSCCFQSGLFGKRLTKNLEVPEGKIKEKVDFNLKELTKQQQKDIQYNIDICKRILQLS